MRQDGKVKVLIICTGNSARSQMAQGLLRKKAGDIADIYSAGIEPAEEVHPLAKRMMEENGIHPSDHHPKSVNLYLGEKFHIIVTTCGKARENCPFFPGNARRYHWELDDPAAVEGTEEERLTAFRRIFAGISERVSHLVDVIQEVHGDL